MKEILKFAIIGIESEIDKKEKSISKGRQLIRQIENSEKSGSIYKVREIMNIKKEEIEELSRKKFDYEWEIAMLEEAPQE